jgi:type I restriction enzyme, S subunit
MMQKVKVVKYTKYKPSGVEWLGEIPEHWELKPGFTVVEERNEKNTGIKENTVLSLSYGNVVIKPEEKLTGLVPESFETYQLVYPGDIIIRPTDLQNDKTSLRTGLAKDKGIITSAYINLKVKNGHSTSFYHYFLHAIDITKVIYGLGTGLRQNLGFGELKRFKFPIPKIEEQTAIATFLDHKTALIDKAIGIKEKQIELLKERRQILIHNAVTRGLNPNVKMKYSGLECIGDIPAHWGIADLRRFTAEHRQGYYSEKGYDDSGHKVVRITDLLENNIIDINESPYYTINKENQERYELRKGDFLFQRTGSHKKIGVFNSDEPTIYASFLIRFRFNEKIDHKFLLCVLNSQVYKQQLNSQIHGGVNPNIHAENIKICKIVLPSIEEQNEIAYYSETMTNKIEAAMTLKGQEIEKLKEYKATLINSAVTGKIKAC